MTNYYNRIKSQNCICSSEQPSKRANVSVITKWQYSMLPHRMTMTLCHLEAFITNNQIKNKSFYKLRKQKQTGALKHVGRGHPVFIFMLFISLLACVHACMILHMYRLLGLAKQCSTSSVQAGF